MSSSKTLNPVLGRRGSDQSQWQPSGDFLLVFSLVPTRLAVALFVFILFLELSGRRIDND